MTYTINEFKAGKFVRTWGTVFETLDAAKAEIVAIKKSNINTEGIVFNVENSNGTVEEVYK